MSKTLKVNGPQVQDDTRTHSKWGVMVLVANKIEAVTTSATPQHWWAKGRLAAVELSMEGDKPLLVVLVLCSTINKNSLKE